MKERYNAIVNKSHQKYDEMLDKSSEFITNWEDRSRDFIMGFISMFGRESFVSVKVLGFLEDFVQDRGGGQGTKMRHVCQKWGTELFWGPLGTPNSVQGRGEGTD